MSAEHLVPELQYDPLRERVRQLLNQTPRIFSEKMLKRVIRQLDQEVE